MFFPPCFLTKSTAASAEPPVYEALRDLPVEDVQIETPIETCMTPMISGKKLAVIPVLRAGLGMVNSILTLVPSAKVGHVGLYRDPVTHEPYDTIPPKGKKAEAPP